ncbi:MAG: hypothetical protein FWF31_00500 [Desulfobulbus sp.]|nr:hypothetical protein [Desulfobulbus sp.]
MDEKPFCGPMPAGGNWWKKVHVGIGWLFSLANLIATKSRLSFFQLTRRYLSDQLWYIVLPTLITEEQGMAKKQDTVSERTAFVRSYQRRLKLAEVRWQSDWQMD